jgi:hypothetical protein
VPAASPVRSKRPFDVGAVQADPGIAEIVFESAWFGRGAFVLLGG